jgi:hypothetical protein
MKYLLILPILVGLYIIWNFSRNRQKNHKRDLALLLPLDLVLEDIKAGKKPNKAIIDQICTNKAQRFLFSRQLNVANQLDILPKQFQTQEAGAMASMCYLLTDTNSLGAIPDEIEWIDTVKFPTPEANKEATYYVYRFKMNPPHWAAASGWRAGVAGPYFPETPFYAMTFGTFSRLDPMTDLTSEEHARWVHENKVVKKGFFE